MSDLQAGHGSLYGENVNDYMAFRFKNSKYIDVLMLVKAYRKVVNEKVNVFSVQVGGYNNSILPENLYRGALLAGWTGNETLYASQIIKLWNEIENIN